MILGFVKVENNAVITHRDSFILTNISVVSVRRPYLAGSLILGSAFLGFGIAFNDLLYGNELAILAGFSSTLLLIGSQVAQLTLLSKDLKGTELSSAVWGNLNDLQEIRTQIIDEHQRSLSGDSHDN